MKVKYQHIETGEIVTAEQVTAEQVEKYVKEKKDEFKKKGLPEPYGVPHGQLTNVRVSEWLLWDKSGNPLPWAPSDLAFKQDFKEYEGKKKPEPAEK